MGCTRVGWYVLGLMPFLPKTLRKLRCLPIRKAQQPARLEELLGRTDKVLIDAAEMPVDRPQNQDEQKGRYSGKKSAYAYRMPCKFSDTKKTVIATSSRFIRLQGKSEGFQHKVLVI